jgi:Fe-S-cluster containining protein
MYTQYCAELQAVARTVRAVTVTEGTDEGPLPAGRFSDWLATMEQALGGEVDADVPCDGCTACCTASQFIHIAPDESGALAGIPSALLFPAPRMPVGHVLMGYDENGRCPMLVDGACSIYEHRPRTCRTYDCRIFPAAGVVPADDAVARRARRWEFEIDSEEDRTLQAAVRAAAAHARDLPDAERPRNDTERAVAAVRLHRRFLDG